MKRIFLTLVILIQFSGFGQGSNPEIKTELPNIIPPSPTVAALMKFEEIPVSNYTGVPDIGIPLFNSPTHSNDLNFNLSLKYHSSVSANDRSSDVGLGWSLIAGGSISRTVRGLPDEQLIIGSNDSKVGLYHTSIQNHNNYYYEHHHSNFVSLLTSNEYLGQKYLWEMIELGKYDSEHDLWQFNFFGKSGRFYIEKNLQNNLLEVKPLDDYRLKIINNYGTELNNNFIPISFTVFDEKGFKFVFDIVEKNNNKSAVIDYHILNTSSSTSSESEFKSAFHLSKVYDDNNILLVEFLFNSDPSYKEHTVNSSYTRNDYSDAPTSYTMQSGYDFAKRFNCFKEFKPILKIVNSISNVSVKKITDINIINHAKINIIYEQGRLDSNFFSPDKAVFVNEIIIKNWQNQNIKKYKFNFDYSNILDNRMMLKKLKEFDKDFSSSKDYDFSYVSNNADGQNIGKDYWGYFSLSLPCQSFDTTFPIETTPFYTTSDLLQKIKYPTGGCALFDFESNRYSFIGDVEISSYLENPDNTSISNSTTLTFANSNLQFLPIFTQEDKKVKFYPSILSNPDPSLNNRTLVLQEKINGVWTHVTSLYCNDNQPNCCIDFVLLKNKEYAVKLVDLNMTFTQSETLIIDYFSSNSTQNEFLYGGGNRIKTIGYFSTDVPDDYYRDSNLQSQFTPIKEKHFDYNYLNSITKSSGSLTFPKPLVKYDDQISIATRCPCEPYNSGPMLGEIVSFSVFTSFNNLISLKTHGSDIGYKYVKVSETGIGFSEYEYSSPIDFPEEILFATTPPFLPSKNIDYKRGLLKKEIIKNEISNPLSEVNYFYDFENYDVKYGIRRYKPNGICYGGTNFLGDYDNNILQHILDQGPTPLDPTSDCAIMNSANLCGYPSAYSQHYSLFEAFGWSKLTSKTTKNYFYPTPTSPANILQTNETFQYNPLNKQISEHTVSTSEGTNKKTEFFYHSGNSIHSQNRISEIETIKSYDNNVLVSESKIDYANNWVGNVAFLPKEIKTKKDNQPLETKVIYNRYDEYGKPLEVQQPNGMLISYIYAYNSTLPVAKIENMAYASIPVSRITAIQNATDTGTYDETNVRTVLDALRNDPALQNAMVSTYIHKPLVGVTSVTDPKGDTQTYEYDGFNRLKVVRDKEGNKLSENEYHYRPQN